VSVAVCAIVSAPPERRGDGRELLEQAVTLAGLWERLADRCATAGRDPAELSVLVLPELLCFDSRAPAGTDPALVEHLVDLLGERGYERVGVATTLGNEDVWLEGRDLDRTASVAGYRRITDGGRTYEIVDLALDVVPVAFPPTSVLHGSGLGRRWLEADVRITFAKNRTHEEHGFALCLHNLLGTLPLKDKLYHYRGRLKPWDVCVDLLRHLPPDFAIIDAICSGHGYWGTRAPEPLVTATIIAAPDTLLADWVGALKMGADPHLSQLNDRALDELGLPEAYDVVGDLRPYEGWRNVHPALLAGVRGINESVGLSGALVPLTTRVDAALFPFKSAALQRANRTLASLLFAPRGEPLAESAAIWLHAWLAAAVEGVDAWRTLFAKQQLTWREVSLDLDLDAYRLADYEAVDGYVEPLEQLIRATPGDHGGLRWRYLDESVLFQFHRVLPVPFEQFVRRVDISRAIHYMQDYIGGRRVAVARDDRGRVTHQAERNIYLPQPNYIVLYGGSVIDVTKLEHVSYTERTQRIRWRTLASANDSAQYDDGSVCFADIGGSYTEITVVARQKFTLPPFWQAVDLDLVPEIKDVLVGDAYFTFFDGTMSNFEAAYAGREYRVGRPWEGDEGESHPLGLGRTSASDVAGMVHRGSELLHRLQTAVATGARAEERRGRLDEHGFRHFSSASTTEPRALAAGVERFLSELSTAVSRDLGLEPGEA
jgi:uncharacterized protein (DUF362 family)